MQSSLGIIDMKIVHPEDEQQFVIDKKVRVNSRQNRYPRESLTENQNNLILGGAYQNYLYKCGECCGCCKTVCPCNCFVQYPYLLIEQGNQGIYLRFGKFIKIVQPGLTYFNPCTDQLVKVDCKLQMIDCSKQWVMTKDNINVQIDGTVYYRITYPQKALFNVNNITQAVQQITLATIKSVVGAHTLSDLLEKKKEIQKYIEEFVDENTEDWVLLLYMQGVDIENMVLTDINLNDMMKETLAVAAKEIRSAQAKILMAQANVLAAGFMKEAAVILDSRAAMQIRYLETIQKLGNNDKTKIILQ